MRNSTRVEHDTFTFSLNALRAIGSFVPMSSIASSRINEAWYERLSGLRYEPRRSTAFDPPGWPDLV